MADPIDNAGAPPAPIAEVPATAVETPAVAAPVVSPEAAPPASLDAPAAVEPPAVEAPVAEPPKPAAKSILANASSEDPKPADPVPEPPKDGAEPPVVAEPPVEGEPLKYESFTLPEGVTLEQEQLGKYTDVLGKHRVPQEAVQELVNLFVAEQTKAADQARQANEEAWGRVRDGWIDKFVTDPEMGGNRQDTTVKACGAVLERFGQQFGRDREAALRQDLEITGMTNHPELIRLINWMSKFAIERARPVAATVPKAPQPQSRGQRRYAASLGNNGAA